MEHMNYTSSRIAWLIYDRNSKVIADAVSEDAANLIIGALNGCN